MGRPINKRYFSNVAGNTNLIEITGDVGFGVGLGVILRQKSTREFIVDIGGNVGRVRLVDNKSPGVGEAYIVLFEPGSDADGFGADFTCDMELTTMAVATDTAGGHSVADTLTIADGGSGSSTTPATLNIDSVIPVDGQDENDYDGAGTPANGTFTAGTTYSQFDIITMSDGTTVVVDVAGGGTISEFDVDSTSTTAGQTSDGVTLTQASVTPDNGAGFELILGVPNQALHTLSNPAASVSILAAGDYQALPDSPAGQTSSGGGSGATITLTDWAVVSGTDGTTEQDDGENYDQIPTVVISGGGGGAGATAIASLDGGTGNIADVEITAQGSGYTSIPTIAFTNLGGTFVERFKAHKVNSTDGDQTVWDNTLGVTPPDGQSKIDNDA